MFLGRRQLGEWLDISLQCQDGNKTPSLPVDAPVCTIRRGSDGVSVYNREMPIVEKEGVANGLFMAKVFLGTGFVAGSYTVQMAFTVGSFTDIQFRGFKIVAAGNPNGQLIGMAYFRRPNRASILYQVEAGRILRGSNPKIN